MRKNGRCQAVLAIVVRKGTTGGPLLLCDAMPAGRIPIIFFELS
jgi:hypothetical protein